MFALVPPVLAIYAHTLCAPFAPLPGHAFGNRQHALARAYQHYWAGWSEMAKMGSACLAQMIVCTVDRPICKRMIGANRRISSRLGLAVMFLLYYTFCSEGISPNS
jgi:hypothetical protein